MAKDIFDIFSITSDRVTNLFRRISFKIVRFACPFLTPSVPFLSISRPVHDKGVTAVCGKTIIESWKYISLVKVSAAHLCAGNIRDERIRILAIVSIPQSEIKEKCIEMQRRIKM